MGRTTQAKYSFAGGVRSPRVSLRSDHNPYTESDTYNESMSIGENFIVTPQGGIQYRQGFQNFRTDSLSSDPTNDSRIFQFHRGGDVSDIIIDVTAGDGLIHFRTIDADTGAIDVFATTLTHTYLQSELADLWFTNQEKIAVILHENHPPYYIEIAIDGSITGELLPANAIPYHDYADADSPAASLTASDTYTCTWVDGTDAQWDDGRSWTFKYNGVYATGNQGNIKEPEYRTSSVEMVDRLTRMMDLIPELQSVGTVYSVLPVGTPDSTNIYEITITGPNAGKTMEINPTNDRLDHYATVVNTMEETETVEPAWSHPTYVLEGGVYYQCILPNTPAAGNQPPNATYWTPLAAKPDTFDWQYPDGNPWTADTPTVRNSYSPGGRGFPTVGVIYEQRLLLMANPGLPMGVFGSRIGNYKDFSLGPQDDDPLFFAIDTSDSPTIKWAEAQRKLIIGTSSGDFALQSDITLTPSNVQATKQNAARSHNAGAVTVGTNIFYIQQGREKMRMTGWNDDLQSQQSIDITVIAQHLLAQRVDRLALMQTPEVLIFGLRSDGTLVCISYSPEQNNAAWTEFSSSGRIIDICGGYNAHTSEDELWALVTYDQGLTRWIEKMPYPARVKSIRVTTANDSLADQNIVCLDGWISGEMIVGDNNVISGLDQFEGLTLTAMVDDAYTGTYIVADGTIVLDSPPPGDVPTYEGTWAVGFQYQGNGKTFEVVTGNQRGVGYGTKRKWTELTVRLLDSALPKINGQLPSDRTQSTEMSVAEICRLHTQDLTVTCLGWGDGSIVILQDRPYPTHILGFYGKVEVEDA